MMRGEFVTITTRGDLGKPRPARVIQADAFREQATVTVLPVASTLVAAPLFRITVLPSTDNGLQKPSQVMVDKAMTVKRDKVGQAFGRIDADAMVEVERCLAVFLGIAK
jgi:mRNA interferase MazF